MLVTQDGNQQLIQTTCDDAAMRQHQATIWQNVSEKGPFFATTFSRPFKDQAGAWRNGTSFGLNDLEALMNVAFEAKEWIAPEKQAFLTPIISIEIQKILSLPIMRLYV